MKKYPFLLGALVLVFFSWSCSAEVSKEEEVDKITLEIQADTDEIKADIEDGMKDLHEGLAEMTSELTKMVDNFKTDSNGDPIETADFRDLKAILPERLLRMERTSFSGERSGIKGLKVSVAEAKYEDKNRQLEVSIIDGGGIPLANIANAGWAMVDIDKEDSNGFERTSTIDGHKAFEKYNSKREEGELTILFRDRFIIAIKGKGIDRDDLRKALDKLDLEDLNDL